MSLASIKQKELKGKKNVLPKLRTILANPYKKHCPVLPESEVTDFRSILKEAINNSNHPLKTFATQTHIHLGLESSLRAINGQRFSCVFVSLSIRPSHILRLIVTSAEVKVPTAPVYAQHKLEELTYELFGVRALTLVLPLDLDSTCPELAKWVQARRKPLINLQNVSSLSTKPAKPKKKKQLREPQEDSVVQQVAAPAEQQEWSGDYISCIGGNVRMVDENDVQTEAYQLGEALSNMAMRVQTEPTGPKNTPKTQTEKLSPLVEPMQMDTDLDDDEFLPASELSVYQPVTLHQIRPNPDKKPKKKRNKNKTKNISTVSK